MPYQGIPEWGIWGNVRRAVQVADDLSIDVSVDFGSSSTEVQAAVDEAESSGTPLFFGPGTWDINVTVDDPVTIRGAGPATVFTSADGSSPIFTFENVDQVSARDFFIDGEWSGAPGLRLDGCRFSQFENIYGDRWLGAMWEFIADGSATQNTTGNTIINTHALNCVRFLLFRGNAALSLLVPNNQFFNVSAVGAGSAASTLIDVVRGSDNLHFVGVCRLQLNFAGSTGVVLNSDAPTSIRDVYDIHFDDLLIDQAVASTVSLQVNDTRISGAGPHASRINWRPGGSNPTAPVVGANGYVIRPSPYGNFTDANRPSAALMMVGTQIWNSDDGAPNWSDGTNWVDATGSTT